MNTHQTSQNSYIVPKIKILPRIQDIYFLLNSAVSDSLIKLLNDAMRDCLYTLNHATNLRPEIDIRVRCIAFAETAFWRIGPGTESISKTKWTPLQTESTANGIAAVQLLTDHFAQTNLPQKIRRPVVVLVSNGHHDNRDEFIGTIGRLEETPAGKHAARYSVGIGRDCNWKRLGEFQNFDDIGILELGHPDDLGAFLCADVLNLVTGGSRHCAPFTSQSPRDLPLPPPPKYADSTTNRSLPIF